MTMAWRDVHPILWVLVAVVLVIDSFLVLRLITRWREYLQAKHWPRLTVSADSVQLVRVMHSREGSPTSAQEYYEAIFDYRYQVAGRDYHKQSVRQVGSQSEADALKTEAKISFLFNPSDPAQTLDAAPGPAAVIGTVIGLLVLNSMLFGLLANVQQFLGHEGS
jgi:hypothetical protein